MKSVAIVFAFALATVTGVTLAQETPSPADTVPMVTVRPGVTVPETVPVVVYVNTTIVNDGGQYALVEIHAKPADGPFTQLTPCDDVIVRCDLVPMRIEEPVQGAVFTLGE